MSLALLFRYLMPNMFRMLIHPSSGACDLFVELFQRLYCSGSMCVGATLWFGWGGVVSVCRLQPAYGYIILYIYILYYIYYTLNFILYILYHIYSIIRSITNKPMNAASYAIYIYIYIYT